MGRARYTLNKPLTEIHLERKYALHHTLSMVSVPGEAISPRLAHKLALQVLLWAIAVPGDFWFSLENLLLQNFVASLQCYKDAAFRHL